MKKLIERKAYLDQLVMWREEEMIKVITGVRRCGKSTLFELYIERLKAEGVTDEQIISINLEDQDFSELLDYKKLHDTLKLICFHFLLQNTAKLLRNPTNENAFICI